MVRFCPGQAQAEDLTVLSGQPHKALHRTMAVDVSQIAEQRDGARLWDRTNRHEDAPVVLRLGRR